MDNAQSEWLKQWAENVFSQVQRIYDILDKHEDNIQRLEDQLKAELRTISSELNKTKTDDLVFRAKFGVYVSVVTFITTLLAKYFIDNLWK